MYEAKKAQIDVLRTRFERQAAEHSPDLQRTATEYLDVLSDFVTTFNEGAGADPRLMGLDTTGELNRIEEQAAWAEQERRRVRKVITENY
jgi:hypothetical protein